MEELHNPVEVDNVGHLNIVEGLHKLEGLHNLVVGCNGVELHNLSRHTATVHDLGRLKTNVIEEAILGKNPYAKVDKYPVNINENLPLLYDEVEKADLIICATDNNSSRFNLSKALVEKGKPGIFGRAITRAEGGDVFRYRPGGPCYCCLVGEGDLREEEITDVASARRDGRIAAYVSPEDADAMVQVGLSSDIEPICNMMVTGGSVTSPIGRLCLMRVDIQPFSDGMGQGLRKKLIARFVLTHTALIRTMTARLKALRTLT